MRGPLMNQRNTGWGLAYRTPIAVDAALTSPSHLPVLNGGHKQLIQVDYM